jgi:hypothetical protein
MASRDRNITIANNDNRISSRQKLITTLFVIKTMLEEPPMLVAIPFSNRGLQVFPLSIFALTEDGPIGRVSWESKIDYERPEIICSDRGLDECAYL